MSNGISAVFHWKKRNCRHERNEKCGRDGEPDSAVPAPKRRIHGSGEQCDAVLSGGRQTIRRPVQPDVFQGAAGGGRGRAGGGIGSISWEARGERGTTDARHQEEAEIRQGAENPGGGESERCELHHALAHHGL